MNRFLPDRLNLLLTGSDWTYMLRRARQQQIFDSEWEPGLQLWSVCIRRILCNSHPAHGEGSIPGICTHNDATT